MAKNDSPRMRKCICFMVKVPLYKVSSSHDAIKGYRQAVKDHSVSRVTLRVVWIELL